MMESLAGDQQVIGADRRPNCLQGQRILPALWASPSSNGSRVNSPEKNASTRLVFDSLRALFSTPYHNSNAATTETNLPPICDGPVQSRANGSGPLVDQGDAGVRVEKVAQRNSFRPGVFGCLRPSCMKGSVLSLSNSASHFFASESAALPAARQPQPCECAPRPLQSGIRAAGGLLGCVRCEKSLRLRSWP